MKKTNIYSIYNDNKPIYVGKTNILDEGKIVVKRLPAYLNNKKLSTKIKSAKNIKVRILEKPTDEPKIWYNQKIERLKIHKKNNVDLVNNYNVFGVGEGYWTGRKKDKHTLKRLSESKFKPIVQYGRDGKFIKIWPSGRHVGKHYRDYQVINGSGETPIYDVVNRKIKTYKNSYWFRHDALIKEYGVVPKTLSNDVLSPPRKKIVRSPDFVNPNSIKVFKYSLKGDKIATYNTIKEAGLSLEGGDGIRGTTLIIKCCNGIIPSSHGYVWKFGEKKSNNKKYII